MQQGDIHLVDLEPVRGAEADKHRPAVIVSNDDRAGDCTSTRSGCHHGRAGHRQH